MSRRTNQLNVEHLEDREVMAGDINAVLVNGVLFMNEARYQSGQENLVTIRLLPNGLLRVEGLADAYGDRTLVNGASFKDFPAGVHLAASMGSGNDFFSVVGLKVGSINFDMSIPGATDTDVVSIYGGTAVNGDLRIRTGGGTDSVFIQDTRIGDGLGLPSEHLTIDTGTGADVVNLAGGVLTSEGVTILAGEGNDTVLIRGTDVGDGRGFRTEDMRIFTGTGADSLHFGTGGERVLVRGNLLVATSFGFETEVDTVRMSHTTVHKTLSVLTGSGDDWVTMDTITATRMSLWTGDGNDTAELVDRVRAGDMFIGMGNGNDVLDMTGVEANFLSADGGAGVDRLFTFKPGSVLRSNVVNLEVINPPRLPFELPPAEKGNLV